MYDLPQCCPYGNTLGKIIYNDSNESTKDKLLLTVDKNGNQNNCHIKKEIKRKSKPIDYPD